MSSAKHWGALTLTLAVAGAFPAVVVAWQTSVSSTQEKTGAATKSDSAGEDAPSSESEGPPRVELTLQPLRLRDPRAYQVSLHLDPARRVTVVAPIDSVVQAVDVTPGTRVKAQDAMVRLDEAELRLRLRRAEALYRAAELELARVQARPAEEDEYAVGLAKAHLEAREAERDLARLQLERATRRAPFDGLILAVHVAAGQFVRAGDPLVEIADDSTLIARVPVERKKTRIGGTTPIAIEETTVEARVQAVLPLTKEFEPLRELANSPAIAVVQVDNADGRFHAGQTVFAPLIPRDPVAEVGKESLAARPDGGYKVQVVRNGVVRDIPVTVLADVGPDRVFVAGRFSENDELVAAPPRQLKQGEWVTIELADGTRIRPAALPGSTDESGDKEGSSRKDGRGTKRIDF